MINGGQRRPQATARTGHRPRWDWEENAGCLDGWQGPGMAAGSTASSATASIVSVLAVRFASRRAQGSLLADLLHVRVVSQCKNDCVSVQPSSLP